MSTGEEQRRRKRTTRRTTDTSKSSSRGTKHESTALPKAEPFERPATVEDLRKARLDYLATPAEERRSKMKYEYVKTVKIKDEAVRVSDKAGSTVSKVRSRTKTDEASTRRRSKKADHTTKDEEAQYVYSRDRTSDHVPGAFDSSLHEAEDRGHRRKSRQKGTNDSRRGTERRHTEPVATQTSRDPPSTLPITSTSRPQPRRSKTAVPERPRTTPRRTSTPVLPGSIHAIPDSESATIAVASTSAKRSGSIFGGFFQSLSQPQPQPIKRKVSCLTCGDDVLVAKTAKLPCTHRMCHACLERIFKLAVNDPAHMPPRCCTDQAIKLIHVDDLFSDEFKKTYNRKFKEYMTRNRIYCPARDCGEWIQPKYIKTDKGRKVGKCPACKTSVCGTCSQKMHKTRDCPKDPATKEFVETAKKAGWQKCYNCSSMVELKEGCNHMTCRCTAEFCMVCGLKWKGCDCPWFSYEQADTNGDPVRYQQEMDRRREQEQRDEAIARRMVMLQVDEDRPDPTFWGAWGTAPRRAGRQARDNITHNHVPEQPPMPGGWDDGPLQFQDIPSPVTRRRNRDGFDPAAQPQDLAEFEVTDDIPVARNRTHRRRGTAPGVAVFEGRALTAGEREQERQIRAWATGRPF